MNTTKRIPDIAESVFDIGYLAFDMIAGIIFLLRSNGNRLFLLYAALTFTLGIGDAFHLIPRVLRAWKGSSETIQKMLGRGLQISSVTMTAFYLLLMYIWQYTFAMPAIPPVLCAIVWISGIVRILICLLPQNDWCGEGNIMLSILRNSVFAVTGACVIALYIITGNASGLRMYRMAIAIAISFGCYIPVTLLSKKKPMIGMLMIPKTCAYIWMIAMGLQML